jgi:hypothetical protein
VSERGKPLPKREGLFSCPKIIVSLGNLARKMYAIFLDSLRVFLAPMRKVLLFNPFCKN